MHAPRPKFSDGLQVSGDAFWIHVAVLFEKVCQEPVPAVNTDLFLQFRCFLSFGLFVLFWGVGCLFC